MLGGCPEGPEDDCAGPGQVHGVAHERVVGGLAHACEIVREVRSDVHGGKVRHRPPHHEPLFFWKNKPPTHEIPNDAVLQEARGVACGNGHPRPSLVQADEGRVHRPSDEAILVLEGDAFLDRSIDAFKHPAPLRGVQDIEPRMARSSRPEQRLRGRAPLLQVPLEQDLRRVQEDARAHLRLPTHDGLEGGHAVKEGASPLGNGNH
eukprot:6840833-Alexandrium_andersonii.AAC.1